MTTTLYKTSSIQKAQTAAGLTNALAFRQLTLRNTQWVGSLSVADRVLSGSLSRTIEGASTLQLTLDDPGFELLNSQLFDFRDDGRLDAIDILVDTLGFRVVKVEPTFDPSSQNVAVTFEEREVALLRVHDSPIAVSRNALTRAHFVRTKLVNEVRAEAIPMISPEEFEKQAIDQPKQWQPDANGQAPSSGFDSGAKLKIEGNAIDADQKRNLEVALQVADVHQATGLARLAMVCAGIGESGFRVVKNPASVYSGVFQADPKNIPPNDTAEQARCFLQGGKGFQGGGAITLARAHPDWTPGHIAYVVEGDRSNFSSDAAAAKFYDDHRADAELIIKAWSGTSGSTGTRTTVKQYQFTRGLPGKRETSWDAMQRLATEVGWRCYVVGGIVYFVSEEWLFMQQALTEIGPDTPGLLGLKGDWDEGKTEQQVTLTIDANRWEYPPGSIIALRGLGPCTGRWLVHTIDRQDIFDPTTEITLTKPLPRKQEPAATLINVSRKTKANASARGYAGTQKKVASYPLPVKGQLIGTPFQGTHAKAFNVAGGSDNWESENAVDLGVPKGTAVIAVDDGTIGPEFGSLGTGGRFAGLRLHLVTNGNEWYYAHLSSFTTGLKPGAKVKAGDVLGKSGEANGVQHLHLACQNGDPQKLLGV